MKWIAGAAVLAAVAAGVLVVASAAPTGTSADQGPPASTGVTPGTEPAEAGATVPEQARKPKRGTRIKSGGSPYGTMLYDRGDQAIYVFDKETGKKSKCYGACAKAWPPVLTKGRPTAGRKVDDGLLGTTKRRNGSRQVTYDGQPLYFYAHERPGQVLCHNVFGFGGLWLVVGPDGDPLP